MMRFLELEGPHSGHLNIQGVQVEPFQIIIAKVWITARPSKYEHWCAELTNDHLMAKVENCTVNAQLSIFSKTYVLLQTFLDATLLIGLMSSLRTSGNMTLSWQCLKYLRLVHVHWYASIFGCAKLTRQAVMLLWVNWISLSQRYLSVSGCPVSIPPNILEMALTCNLLSSYLSLLGSLSMAGHWAIEFLVILLPPNHIGSAAATWSS